MRGLWRQPSRCAEGAYDLRWGAPSLSTQQTRFTVGQGFLCCRRPGAPRLSAGQRGWTRSLFDSAGSRSPPAASNCVLSLRARTPALM